MASSKSKTRPMQSSSRTLKSTGTTGTQSASASASPAGKHENDLQDVIYEHADVSILDDRNKYISIVLAAANGNSLQFSCSQMDLPSYVSNTFMCRRSEDAYKVALGKAFTLDLFPPRLKAGIYYQPEYEQLSRYVTAFRIRRLVLTQEIDSFGDETRDLLNLQAICQEKKTALSDRILTLENEINNLEPLDPSSPSSRFNALLMNQRGWKTVNFFFHKELKRLQGKLQDDGTSGRGSNSNNGTPVSGRRSPGLQNGPPSNRSNTGRPFSAAGAGDNNSNHNGLVELGEEVDETLTLDILSHCWKLLVFWRVVRCVESMCRCGPDKYPHKKVDDDNLNGLNVILETSLSRSMDLVDSSSRQRSGDVTESIPVVLMNRSRDPHELASIKALEMPDGHASDTAHTSSPHLAGSPITKLSLPVPSSVKSSYDFNSGVNNIDANSLNSSSAIDNSLSKNSHGIRGRLTNIDIFSPLTGRGHDSKMNPSDNESSIRSSHQVPQPGTTMVKQSSIQSQRSHHSNHSHHGHHSHRSHRGHNRSAEVKLVHQFKSDQIIASWKDVCALLKTENLGTITAAHAIQAQLTADPEFMKLMEKATITNLAFGLSEAAGDENTNEFIASSMTGICDSLANSIERQLLHAMRMMPGWLIMLEELRRDRVKANGGKLLVKEKVEIEIDATGKRKTYAIPDVYVDTDVLHNIMQRLHFQVVAPAVAGKLQVIKDKRTALKGELACLMQFGYELVAPFIQRNVRRIREQRRYSKVMRLFIYCAMHASTVIIQSMARMQIKRRWYLDLKARTELARRHAAATAIQRIARGRAAFTKYQAYLRHKRYLSDWFAITRYQALIRGFIARHRLKKRLDANAAERQNQIRLWGVTKIQKIIRGFLARKVLVPSLRLRKSLSPEMLRLVEAYLQKGDLWKFLRQLDAELVRLRKELADNDNRENVMASTFLQKVLTRRANEFDSSWAVFSDAIESHQAGIDAKSTSALKSPSKISSLVESNSIGIQLELQDGKLTAMGKPSTAVANANLIGNVMNADDRVYTHGHMTSHSGSVSRALATDTDHLGNSESIEETTSAGMFIDTTFDLNGSSSFATQLSPGMTAGTGTQSPLSSPMRRSLKTNKATKSKQSTSSVTKSVGTKQSKPPPGALLRRALTTSIQTGVDAELEKLKDSSSRTTRLTNELKEVYGQQIGKFVVSENAGGHAGPMKSASTKMKPVTGAANGASHPHMSASTSDWFTNAAVAASRPNDTVHASKPSQLDPIHPSERLVGTSKKPNRKSNARAARASSPSRPVSPTKRAYEASSTVAVPNNLGESKNVSAMGNSLLVDVPRGLEDTWERLLKAASIRCYVPKVLAECVVNLDPI
jgi:hypothetical protein